MMSTRSSRALILIGFAVVLLAGLLGGIAIADNGDHIFYACEKDGKVIPGTIQVDEGPTCTDDKVLVSWNSDGPQGDKGDKGDKGDPGDGGAVPSATDAIGGSGAHPNTQPNVVVNCIIAVQGTFPTTGTQATPPFLGQISWFAGNFAPAGWAFCNGQLLQISQNTALWSLLGTTYGGDGRVTFGLPDARGRSLVHAGAGPGLTNRQRGSKYGTETETLTVGQMPTHTHGIS